MEFVLGGQGVRDFFRYVERELRGKLRAGRKTEVRKGQEGRKNK